MGSGGNNITFGGYIGFDSNNNNTPNPLAFVSLIAGSGADAVNGGSSGDYIKIQNPIKADQYVVTSGNGGANQGGGAGGGVMFTAEVNIGSGGMDITAGIDGANNGGSAGSIDFIGDVIFYGAASNTSYIRAGSSNGTAGLVNFSGNLQGVSANDTVLSLSSNARVLFSGSPLTVTGKVEGDSTIKLQAEYGTNITFTSDVIFQDSINLGSIEIAYPSSAIFQGNLTAAVTVGDDAAIILHDAPI